jgi:hypothetical protein
LAPAIRDRELVKTLRREDSQGSNHSSRDRLDSSHLDSHRILLVHRDRKDPVWVDRARTLRLVEHRSRETSRDLRQEDNKLEALAGEVTLILYREQELTSRDSQEEVTTRRTRSREDLSREEILRS